MIPYKIEGMLRFPDNITTAIEEQVLCTRQQV